MDIARTVWSQGFRCLVCAGASVCLWAVVVDRRGKTNDVRDDVLMVAFLRPENHSRLRVGQTLLVQLDPAGERTRRPFIAIEPKIISGFVINGEAQNNSSGSSVSGVGDVNGDGLDDLIIGTSSAKKS